ncbi:MAG: 6-carboxytetrahydropterin synthase [Thermoleophilaceae bacterium]
MLTTLEMARAEFGFYAAHLALYDGEVEPLHGHTFHVALRVSGEPDASGMLVAFSR